MSALYSNLILAHFAQAGGAYDTLSNVRLLFADDMFGPLGWLLAFLVETGLRPIRLMPIQPPRLMKA